MSIQTDFSSRLKQIMDEKNTTCAKLAEHAGLNIDTIINYRLGRSEPKVSLLQKLCDALDVSPNYLMGVQSADYDDEEGATVPKYYKTVFQRRLELAMSNKGMATSELAKITDLPEGAIHNYLVTGTDPVTEKLELLCRALGVTPNWMLGWED